MKSRKFILLTASFLLGCLPAAAASSDAASEVAPKPTRATSESPLAPLAHLVGGQWRGEIKLLDGTLIRARHVFEWGLGGKILKSKTWGAFGDRAEQLVYEGIFAWHPERKKITFQEFAAYGGTNEGTIEPQGNAFHYSWTQYGDDGSTVFKETLVFPDPDHYTSEAFKKTGDGWERFTVSSSFQREPLESQASVRALRKEVTVKAPLAEVWRAWTTSEGAKSFFGPEARIEPTPGGPYEIYFALSAPEGQRGSERCKVHSVVPMKQFGFTWNQPPSIPVLRDLQTVVLLRFEEPIPGEVRIELTHTGWGVGEDWDRAYNYFDRAWDAVLGNLKYRFAVGPVDWPGGVFRAAKIESRQP